MRQEQNQRITPMLEGGAPKKRKIAMLKGANVEYESQRRIKSQFRIQKPTRDIKPTLIKPSSKKKKARSKQK
ncbi:26952_t:CDS:2, partial [Gigaspora margarita]